ncbi:hypothetical protein NXC24_PC01378 (plasmid) [Rhizobium sp. NXC24]|nr:hypothetical protein NXC24_PC01378 [Rhizobium sp. NXC24]
MPTRSRRSDENQALQHLSTLLRDWLKTIGLFSEIIARQNGSFCQCRMRGRRYSRG